MKSRPWLLWFAFLITLGSGAVNVISVIGPGLPTRHSVLREIFPIEFLHIARSLTLLIGFALIVLSINILKSKKRAFYLALLLSVLSVVFHLTKGLDYEEAALSLVLCGALLLARRRFTVKSSVPDLRLGFLRLLVAAVVVLGYGIAGFYFLDKREFGIDFTFIDSIHKTLGFLSWTGDPDLVPHTRYARWFLDSLYAVSTAAVVYSLFALFRPVLYKLRTLPRERTAAADILIRHGRSAMEYFKVWPDKSYFFSPSGKSFLAYGVGGSFALVLADPVGPGEEIKDIVLGFMAFCREHDWKVAFHQTLPDFLPIYKELGFHKLKIGDEGIVDLKEFSLDGKRNKHLRHYTNQFDKSGFQAVCIEPPVPGEVLAEARQISDEWLSIPGRGERGFTQDSFRKDDIRRTPVFVVKDENRKLRAFANIIPSYHPGETTIDLMRHGKDAPPGVMDYLFVKLFADRKAKGFTRFNLGMAPMSGFQEKEEASSQERTVHYFLQRLNFLFSYQGLFHYKKKFATGWEPRYEVYRNVTDLPRLAVALSRVALIKGGGEE